MKRQFHALTCFLVLVLATLACGSGTRPVSAPTALPSVPTFDPNTTETFENQWVKAITEAVATGQFSFTVTEGQFTDFINRKNAENANSKVSGLQVFLRDGQIQLIGQAESDAGSANLEVFISVNITSESKVQFTVTSAKLGPFPVPQNILDNISTSINDALTRQDNADKVAIESIEIRDGFMTISGKIK